MKRRDFIKFATTSLAGSLFAAKNTMADASEAKEDVLDLWQRETDAVKPSVYDDYMLGKGNPGALVSIEKLERAFAKILEEVRTTVVTDRPAVWLVYNMGFIIKTRETTFSIDLVHRRACEMAPILDFALITHNHSDHYRPEFYRAMNGAGKTVISNFLDNYGGKKGGYTRARKEFRIKDVEIATFLVDHNNYLIDFTTGFEIRVGDWKLLHTGDCSNVNKIHLKWGRPDVWLAFPGCGIDIGAGERMIRPKRMVFGHLWELAHKTGRLTTPMVRSARAKVLKAGGNVTVPLWGDRIC